MKLNPEQKLAVDHSGQNILVFASAGAGKTTIMVQRLLKRIISDHLSLDEMVAMTFTNAASANLKNRLSQAIEGALLKDPSNTHLQNERAKVPDAHISTIHSFCLELLKEYYYKLDLSLKTVQNLIDDTHAKIAIDKLLDEIIQEELQDNNTAFLACLDALSNQTADMEMFKEELKALFNKIQNELEPLAYLEKEAQRKHISTLQDYDQEGLHYYLHLLKAKLCLIIKDLKKMDQCEKFKGELTPKIEELESLLSYDDYGLFLNGLSVLLKAPKSYGKDPVYTAYRKDFEKHAKALAKELLEVKKIIANYEGALDHQKEVVYLVKRLYLAYQDYKRQKECLDFSDIEHYTFELLNKDDAKIAKDLKHRFKEIMVDEFQDTSPLQYAIIRLISHDNLFLVGDVKQSIYRFRHASPKIMEDLKEDDSFYKIHLKHNYRSKERIVSFNNAFFDRIMNLNKKRFNKNDAQLIGSDQQIDPKALVSFSYYVLKEEDTIKADEVKAKIIADKIIKFHKEGLAFRDMAVLVRSHHEKKPLKKVFEALHIPYFINDNDGYFKSFAIETLLAYLNYLLDEDDKIALVAILTSLYRFSANDLALAKGHFDTIMNQDPFRKDYLYLKGAFLENDFETFMAYFLGIDHFYDRLNIAEKTNLDLLINKYDSYKIKTFAELRNFIIEALDTQKEVALSISEDADVVKVMTIHNSKGLEFDTVFLYSALKTKSPSKKRILYHPTLPLGLRFIDGDARQVKETLSYKLIDEDERYEEALEYQRLFYVALTRAVSKLLIVDCLKDQKKIALDTSLLYDNSGFTSYILSAAGGMLIDDRYLSLPDLEPLSGFSFDESEDFLHFAYQKTAKEKIAPSSLEKHDLALNLNFQNATSFGTKMHEVMEKIDLEQADLQQFKLSSLEKEMLASIFLDPIFQKALKGLVQREYSFYLKKDTQIIHGFMDFVSFLADEVIIIDYKTDHINEEDVFQKTYRDQLKMYQKVLQDAGYQNIKTYIYSFYLKKMIAV